MASLTAAVVVACIAGVPDPAWPGTCVTDARWHEQEHPAPETKGGRDGMRPAAGYPLVPASHTRLGGGRRPQCPHSFQTDVAGFCVPPVVRDDPTPVPLPRSGLLYLPLIAAALVAGIVHAPRGRR